MKERIKYFLISIFFFILAGILFSQHEEWVLVLFDVIEIPHTGLLVAGVFALGGLGALFLAFEKKKKE